MSSHIPSDTRLDGFNVESTGLVPIDTSGTIKKINRICIAVCCAATFATTLAALLVYGKNPDDNTTAKTLGVIAGCSGIGTCAAAIFKRVYDNRRN